MLLLKSVNSSHKHLFNIMLNGCDSLTLEQVKKTMIANGCIKMEESDVRTMVVQ